MKKLITILFLMSVVFVYAQDNQETLKWLNKNKKYIVKKHISGEIERGKIEMTQSYIKYSEEADEEGETYEKIIKWKDVKKVNYTITDSGRYHIYVSSIESDYINIRFTYSGDGNAMVDKLAHMAKLHGADVEVEGQDLRGIKLFE